MMSITYCRTFVICPGGPLIDMNPWWYWTFMYGLTSYFRIYDIFVSGNDYEVYNASENWRHNTLISGQPGHPSWATREVEFSAMALLKLRLGSGRSRAPHFKCSLKNFDVKLKWTSLTMQPFARKMQFSWIFLKPGLLRRQKENLTKRVHFGQ